jgi:hypothetical protein
MSLASKRSALHASAENGSPLNTLSAQSSREILRGRDFRISVAKSIKERIFTPMIERGLEKVIHNFPHDMQPLFPAIASTA